jgi:toxin ParE1/3/4
MPQIKRTSLAQKDAIEIWAFIAEDNESAADKVIAEIDSRLKSLSFMPLSGTAMPFIAPDIRRTVVGRYSIYYRAINDGIEVLRILHERRQHDDLFSRTACISSSLPREFR